MRRLSRMTYKNMEAKKKSKKRIIDLVFSTISSGNLSKLESTSPNVSAFKKSEKSPKDSKVIYLIILNNENYFYS